MDADTQAVLSECGRYRYFLRRIWDADLPLLAVCMLNPSSADAEKDDPTVRKLTNVATRWGYGGLAIVNLYPLRASKPSVIWDSPDRADNGNDEWLDAIIKEAESNGNKLLVAWGNDGNYEGLADQFIERVKQASNVELITLGLTGDGHPRHPMALGKGRVPDDQNIVGWAR